MLSIAHLIVATTQDDKTIKIKQTSSNEDKVIVRRKPIADRINPEMGGSINSLGFFLCLADDQNTAKVYVDCGVARCKNHGTWGTNVL